jgi:hypothetical protein
VITSATQRISGAAVAALGLSAQLPTQDIITGLCYLGSTGNITNFVGNDFTIVKVSSTRFPYAAAASVSGLAPGIYEVGFCVLNDAANTVGANDFVNGWVMVTE